MSNIAEARQKLVELCVELSARGYLAATGGNVSLRVDTEHFLITPSATDYLAMRASDICLLRLSDLAKLERGRTPSVEKVLHARLFHGRPDAGCCIHTHQPVASACALMGKDLTVPEGEMLSRLGPVIPLVGYAPSGTNWLAAKLARALRPDVNAYLLLNHGVVCCGAGIAETVQTVEDLEAVTKSYLSACIAERAGNAPQLAPILTQIRDALTKRHTLEPSGAKTR